LGECSNKKCRKYKTNPMVVAVANHPAEKK
jgi:hypothetical protein